MSAWRFCSRPGGRRESPWGAVALVFLALAAALILCVRYAAVESRTLSLIVYYLMMNNWLFILPGAALGFAVSFRPPLGD